MPDPDRPSTSDLLRGVGRRVHELRTERALTLDQLSARSGVSRRMITMVESAETNASLGTLDKLARALGSDFAALVGGSPATPLTPEATGSVVPLWEDGRGSSARLLVTHPGRSITELWQWELVAGGRYEAEADPPGSEEIIFITAGRLVVEVGEESHPLAPGDYIRLPTDVPYAYANPQRSTVRFLRVVSLA